MLMETPVLESLLQARQPQGWGGLWHGVHPALVTDIRDPDSQGRVKIKLPWSPDGGGAACELWARLATFMGGNDRGAWFVPDVDDEVLVAFEAGDGRRPYVIGALWNGKDTPPENNDNGSNDHRSFTSRSGHVVRLNDASGQETVEIIDKSGSNRIVIDTSARKIRIEADGDIEITSSTGKVKISGLGIELTSQTDVKVQAQTTVDINANAQASIQAALVKIN